MTSVSPEEATGRQERRGRAASPATATRWPVAWGRGPAAAMTVAILAVAASVGTAAAGADPFATLASFRQPWFALAPWGWVTVGVLYYAAMAVILYRLLRRSPSSRRVLRLVVAIVLANEAWNALVFGVRAPWAAAVGLVAFAALVAGTVLPARRQDPVTGWMLLGYLVWLVGYDLPWILLIAVNAAA